MSRASIKSRWKAFERRVAKFFGTTRTPLSGGNSKMTRSDTLHDRLFVEARQRQGILVVSWFRSATRLAKLENKIPMLVIAEPGDNDYLLCFRSRDLLSVIQEFPVSVKRTPSDLLWIREEIYLAIDQYDPDDGLFDD